MKFFFILLIFLIFQGCSFDTKTNIWKNEKNVTDQDKNSLKRFKTLNISEEIFDKVIPINRDLKFKIKLPVKNSNWNDIFYNKQNSYDNFSYSNLDKLQFKSKKITQYNSNKYILFNKGIVILSDEKGNIFSYSLNEKKIIDQFNFYRKKLKKVKKYLNLILENDIVYISDNIGYLYAYNLEKKKLIWAKNYKIPFRSNLKINGNKLITSNQNNNLIFFEKESGKILSRIPTEETTLKNEFINNIAQNNNDSLFLNTYGSLYSISNRNNRINWFLNLNRSIDLSPSTLFDGSEIVNDEKYLVISSNDFTFVIDVNSGSIINKINFSSVIKPLIINDYLFLVTRNDLLISWDLKKQKIIYSYDINQSVAEFLNSNKKKVAVKNFIMANNDLYIFLKNSYVLKFSIRGKLKKILKLKSKINSQPIFVDSSLIYLDKNNKISVVN